MKLLRNDVFALALLSGLVVSSIGQAQAVRFFDSLTGGFTNQQLTLDVFLLEAYGGASPNTITFRDLSLTADSFSPNFVTGAVPEPSTWAMMLLGFAGIGYGVYRRRKVAPAAFVK